jgi:hypothetical protein
MLKVIFPENKTQQLRANATTAVTDQSRWPPGYNSWNDKSPVTPLATVDEEHIIDLGHTDKDHATNMEWNGAGGGCSGPYGCGCGWCSGSSRARKNSGWGSGVEESGWGSGGVISSGCGRRGDGSGWGKDSSGRWTAARITIHKDHPKTQICGTCKRMDDLPTVSIRFPLTLANTVELREWIENWYRSNGWGSFGSRVYDFHLFASFNPSDCPVWSDFSLRSAVSDYMNDLMAEVESGRRYKSEVSRRCSDKDVANFLFSGMRSRRTLERKSARGRLMQLCTSKAFSYVLASCCSP